MDPDLDRVLPAGIARDDTSDPPPAPAGFGEEYVLPAHSEKPLQKLHAHPKDARLEFLEKPHVYLFDGAPLSCSVTALAHAFETPFVAAEGISLMKNSRTQKWPRREYVRDLREGTDGWTTARGLLVVCDERTVSVVQPHALRHGSTVDDALELAKLAALKGYDVAEGVTYTFERAATDGEIQAQWAAKGQDASHRGTEAHYMAERFANGLSCRWWEPEMRVLFDFVREHMIPDGMVVWNTEKEIVCEDADVAGSIDLIVWDERRQCHHIVDYKRSDKLAQQMRGYGKMRAPFNHLDDCKGAGYALQTSIYQYILERDYGMRFGDRILLSLHPDRPFATSVPYLRAEVEHVMATRIALTTARRAVAAADARFRCSLTGVPAVDAVRLRDGAVAAEKAAIARDRDDAVPDYLRRTEMDEAVARAIAPVAPLDTARVTPWRRAVPASGRLTPFRAL